MMSNTDKATYPATQASVRSEKCILMPVIVRLLPLVLPLVGLYILRLESITLILKNLLLRLIC